MLHHSPVLYGHDRHSWTLESIGATISWMRGLTISAICQLLKRFQLVYKRGRAHVHSPDLDYDQKLAAIHAALAEARSRPEQVTLSL